MKRIVTGSGILLVLLLLGLLISWMADREYPPICRLLEEAAGQALQENMEQAIPPALEAKQLWQSCRNRTAAVADHTPMEEIDHLFAEMEIYARAEEAPHFAACCSRLAKMVGDMGEAHKLNLQNLF